MSFQHTNLFGGAITVDLPTGFGDVSDIRQVPDTQEVYLDANGFTSIIFDILEWVEDAASDEAALKVHFQDIVDGSGDATNFHEVKQATLAKMPSTPAHTLLAIQTPATPPTPPRNPQPDFTAILLTLVRLAEQKTDITIAINVPHVAEEYALGSVDLENGKPGVMLEAAAMVREKVLASFEVKDWGLFVN
ncbi:Mog1p/PsbP-like protein [Mytilinidion resinicola]|uniref:Mog1p/PsbP-like protein n=1 Tax=Mytilinidion resinicola TaxID=574789 RepID=A0A6A6Z0M3_9PEZI|nr:Mog1p/PsbP-like protein [Mytilinidion resinicola]KAF2814253.1 Mog1p/PsbP-like protein [Mytilinidion resinicola]